MVVWILFLRLVHIFGGIFWGGTAFFLATHIGPAAAASGEHGQKFMQQLITRQRLSQAMALSSSLTFFSGLLLFYHLWLGAMSSPQGMFLGTGGVIGALAWLHGGLAQGRLSAKMKTLGDAMASAGGPPSEAQIAEMQGYADRLGRQGNIAAVLVALAIVVMATFQYFPV